MPPLDITVRRTTAAQQVAEGLSDLIMSGRFSPGTRLRESAIATELGIARNTVREAVRILELGGLVTYEVNRGAVVLAPTPDSVKTLYLARKQLETAAVLRLAPEADLTGVRAALDALRAAAAKQQVGDIVSADLDFHAAIVALLGSTRIDGFYTELTTELRYYLTVLSLEDREYAAPDDIVGEHLAILEALESRDPTRAADAITAHIDDNADRVCEILRTRDAAS